MNKSKNEETEHSNKPLRKLEELLEELEKLPEYLLGGYKGDLKKWSLDKTPLPDIPYLIMYWLVFKKRLEEFLSSIGKFKISLKFDSPIIIRRIIHFIVLAAFSSVTLGREEKAERCWRRAMYITDNPFSSVVVPGDLDTKKLDIKELIKKLEKNATRDIKFILRALSMQLSLFEENKPKNITNIISIIIASKRPKPIKLALRTMLMLLYDSLVNIARDEITQLITKIKQSKLSKTPLEDVNVGLELHNLLCEKAPQKSLNEHEIKRIFDMWSEAWDNIRKSHDMNNYIKKIIEKLKQKDFELNLEKKVREFLMEATKEKIRSISENMKNIIKNCLVIRIETMK